MRVSALALIGFGLVFGSLVQLGMSPQKATSGHALALLRAHDDDVLTRCDVVALHDVEPRGDHPEGFSQALGAECEGVAATHVSKVRPDALLRGIEKGGLTS